VFERLFGRAGTPAQRRARMQRDRSLLDSIAADVVRLRGWLGARDRVRLGEYLDNVREIERRIQRMEAQANTEALALDAPVGVPDDYAEHAGLLFDLAAVAYQADLTRVLSFMMARDLSTKTYPNVGVASGHHDVSHHGGNPTQVAAHASINVFHLQLFANFLEKLRTTPDGDGSVLDHSLIVYGSGMGNGNIHAPDQLPMAVIGGPVKRGHRHIQTADKTPLGNLWLSVAHAYDLQVDRFGDSAGTVDIF
jgi:predicted component of type VI protein secretion system